MLNVLALEVLVTDEFLPLLPWEVREEREGVSREESLPQRDGIVSERTHWLQMHALLQDETAVTACRRNGPLRYQLALQVVIEGQ